MAQVNECKSKVMSAKKVGIFAVIANEQCSELVDPSKAALAAEALPVDRGIEQAFTPAFDGFPVAFVVADVGNDVVIETNFPRLKRIKGAVGVEESARNRQSQLLHPAKGILQMRLEVEGVMMVACDDPGRSHHIALCVGDGQDIRRFRSFSVLVGDTFAAFLRQRVTAIKVQMRQIEVFADRLNTLLPDPLQAAIGTPFLKVVVDRLPAYLFFSASLAEGAIGNCIH